jgi:hypothetical protein
VGNLNVYWLSQIPRRSSNHCNATFSFFILKLSDSLVFNSLKGSGHCICHASSYINNTTYFACNSVYTTGWIASNLRSCTSYAQRYTVYEFGTMSRMGPRYRSIGILTRLWAGRFGVQIPAGTRDFSFLKIVQTGSAAHQTSYSMGTAVLSRGYSGRSVILTTYSYLYSPLYAFIEWTGTNLPFGNPI